MVASTTNSIAIKGIREGLLISLSPGAYNETRAQLTAELNQKSAFLQGSQVALAVGERPFSRPQLLELKELLERHKMTLWAVLSEREETRAVARDLGLATRLPGSHTDLDGRIRETADSAPVSPKSHPHTEALLFKETIRSGRSIYHEGHVVIIGDVNPGAEVMAGGDVVVWGRLRGLVHAGAKGDKTAVICALDLSPTQLRIADQIAVPPSDRGRKPIPEQAAIRNGQIVAEPWQTR